MWIDQPSLPNISGVVVRLNMPMGIDYHPPTQSLLIADNYGGDGWNFGRIDTNGVVWQWSGVKNMAAEINLTTVKTTTNGFTIGDMYFASCDNNGDPIGIGWLSADGTVSNLNWVSLTNANPNEYGGLSGGLYIDQSGSFGGDMIAVTGSENAAVGGGVYRITSSRNITYLANVTNYTLKPHLEGVITLTNDVAKWGPWAGKIVTGAAFAVPTPLIFAINTNGTVTSYDLGIATEDIDLIPANQNLYCTDNSWSYGGSTCLVKFPSNLFTNYVGDLLISVAHGTVARPSGLVIVHWDGVNLITRRISYDGDFEGAVFAPINIPTYN
jgi:hypothetical protein